MHEILNEPNRLQKIKQYIAENISTDLRAAVVASKYELSTSSLQRLFKKYEKRPYHHYIEEYRMRLAFDLIRDGKRVQQTMYATGYKYKSTFNKAFKKKFRHPPRFFQT